ncbi:MAG TPA: cytochrome c3 family protein [Rhodothermales bacterium]|nr:cytochrome c3 family protein [Rhodothermales bacterium]
MSKVGGFLLLVMLCGAAWPSVVQAQEQGNRMHGGFTIDIDCSTCHKATGWTPLRDSLAFDHGQQTSFPLTGRHAQAECANCHLDARFDMPKVAANDCASCHVDVHQGEFAGACVDCHNTTSFEMVNGLEVHSQTSFPLTGAHMQISCESCHTSDQGGAFTLLDTDCLSCHEPDYEEAHGEQGFPTTCASCHNTLAWAATPLFDHAAVANGFALLGAHEPLECVACHEEPDFEPAFQPASQDDCFTCHQPDYEEEHAGTGFPTTCLECHTINTWDDATFEHATVANGFALVGAHDLLECSSCHGPPPGFDPLFQPASQDDCFTCHQPDYDDAHAGSGFPTTCIDCHNTNNWEDADFEHAAVANGFALVGAHMPLPCSACHSPPPIFDPLFQPTNQDDCFTCHQSDYEDEHGGTGFPTACLECHNTQDWDDAVFDHGVVANGFDLVGAHDDLECSSCHAPPPGFDPLFQPASQDDCFTCHQPDYEDEHAGSSFPTTCLECHNTEDWDDADFAHASVANGFDLLGAHNELECASCHNPPPDFSPIFTPSSDQDCLTCHQSDYEDEHAGTGFPTACLECHNTQDWDDADFAHATVANGFALVGAHDLLECSSCHGPPPGFDPLFQPASQDDCFTCHQPDYEDEHAGSGFPTTCLECHNTEDWGDSAFDHVTVSNGFDLLGAHDNLDCSACHGPPPDFVPRFQPANDEDCLTCHQADYDQQHAGSGFPTNCLECHNSESWQDATFDHAAIANGFALVGAHIPLPCTACHTPPPDFDPLFNPTSQDDCITCHQPEYDQQHAGTGFPTDCQECHTVDTWTGVTFDHGAVANGFNLIGAHNTLECASCHAPLPDFTPLFNPANEEDCLTCHQPDYDQQHAGTGFPTNCLECHNTDTWDDAVFDHAATANGFALVGAHETLECSSCHAPPPDFDPLFDPVNKDDCISCHQPDYDQEHAGTGFPTTCLECHNINTWEDAVFDHAATANGFRLLGAHESLECSSCHAPPPDFTPLFEPEDDQDCLTCHQPDYDQQHAADGFPYECQECHTVDTWTGATFSHSASSNGFALVGAHETLPCNACHAPPPDFTPLFDPIDQNDCFSCHQSDYQQEHGGQGFPTNCLDCHNTNDWDDTSFDHDNQYFPIFDGEHEGEWQNCQTCHTDPNDFNIFTCLVCHEHRQSEMDDEHDEVQGYVYESNACYSCHPNGEED